MLARRTIVGMRWMLMLGAHVRSREGRGMTKIEVLSVPRFMFCLPICTCSAVPRLPVLTASLAFSRGWARLFGRSPCAPSSAGAEIEGRRPFVERGGAPAAPVRGWELRLFLAGVFVLQVCCQFMPAACRTNSSQPGPSRIPVVHSYHVHVESSAFSQTGG